MTDNLCPTCGRSNSDDQESCEFCGSPLGFDDFSLRNDLLPPEEIGALGSLPPVEPDDSSRLDDFFQSIEPEASSLRNDFFPPDEDDVRDSLEPSELHDSSPLKDFSSSEEIGDQDSIQPTESDDPSLLNDFISSEEIDNQITLQPTEPLDDDEPDLEPPSFSEDSGWLDMLQDPDSTADEDRESEVVPVSPPIEGKSGTDWLEKIKRLNKSSDELDDDSSFPDWLSITGKTEVGQKAKPEESDSTADELPDWLQMDGDDEKLNEFLQKKDLYDSDIKPEDSEETISEEKIEEKETTSISIEESVEHKKFPSWAADDASTPAKGAQEIPEELRFLAGVEPFQIEEEEFFDDLFSEELPGWLTKASGEEGTLIIEDEISPGDLPGWVEAMRPVVESTDSTSLSEDEDYIENYGPLAGIPSVLPAEAEFALDAEQAAKKPLDLIATKSHLEYVNLLRKLIGEEKKVKPIKKAAPVQTQRILRWLIAIILIITIGVTIIFGGTVDTQLPPEGQIINSGYGALYNQIDELYDGQPVLIAFDYQPAATAEMHIAAAAVVDHLMEQGTYLSFISTQPTGPVLAEFFLTSTQEKHDYRHNQQYINLGYLPGESAGLVSFVIAPKKIIPLAFDGSNAWESPPLAKVDSIGDFAMILVITDDPNTAKIWIEQVGTHLENTPLNMVVSAQVEPLIQPYFRASPQLLSGYVSGVIHGLNYEHLREQPNLANAAWLPFNIGIFITVGTIFIGGLANGVLSLFSRHRAGLIGEI